jgi:uncharacterized membrane protein
VPPFIKIKSWEVPSAPKFALGCLQKKYISIIVGYVWMNWTLIASTIIGIILVLFVKEEYRRTDADNEESESNNT